MTSLHRVVRCLLLLALVPAPLLGQAAKVRVRENFRSEPGGEVIAVLEPGLALTRAGARDGWLEVDVEGWVWMQSLQTTTAAGHDLVVTPTAGENLRERPSGAILGKLGRGTLLDEQERVAGWVRVRRRGWIWTASVDTASARPTAAARPAAPPATPARSPAATATGATPGGAATTRAPAGAPSTPAAPPARSAASRSAGAAILAGPGGDTIGRVGPAADLQVLAREGSWARVRVEGWVWMPPGDSAGVDLTPVEAIPAQLAAEPDRFRGRVVSWDLQFLSLERAERIRTEFFEGEPFLLTRHPAGGYVYVAVSPDRLTQAGSLNPLERIRVVGRVRVPASALTGSPILDLMELERSRDRR